MQVSILYAGRVEAGFGIKSLKTPLSDKVRLLNSYRFRNGVYMACLLYTSLEGQAHEYPNHPELRKSDANIVGHILDKNTKEHCKE